jgi:hypothetical protein
MKRLLAYLFIVLGLGLTFNAKANLSIYDSNNFNKDGVLCLIKRINSNGYSYFYVDESEIYKLRDNKYNWAKILSGTNVKYDLTTQEKKELKFCNFKIYKSKNYDSYFALKKQWELTGGFESPSYISNKVLSRLVDKNLYAEIIKDNNTQITKAEPSQTQKVAKNIKDLVFCLNTGYPSATDVFIKKQLESNQHNNTNDVCKNSLLSLVEIGFEKWKVKFPNSKTYIYNDGFGICVSPPYSCDNLKQVLHSGVNFYDDYTNKKTQIAKAEPSQTKKVVKKGNKSYRCIEGDCENSIGKEVDLAGNIYSGRFVNNRFFAGKKEITSGKFKGSIYVGKFIGYRNLVHGYSKTIQKLNTGQTSVHDEYLRNARRFNPKNIDVFKKEIDDFVKELYSIDINKSKYACLVRGSFVKENFVVKHVDILKTTSLDKCEYKIYPTDKIYNRFLTFEFIKENDLKKIISSTKKTQTAKAEPTVKPKKKVKVAKVEEPKQEEFKPKKTNQDNEAPVIEIAEAITVDSQAYTLKGKVKDKSQIYLTINGRQVDVKKGKFEFPGFVIDPSEGEVLKIVAIDRWQNKSEKTINIKVEFKQTADARSYEKPNPNNIRTKTDNDKIGIIIGIEKYQALSNLDAPYANRDANAFRAYATRALGIPNKNLKVLIDDEATRSGLLKSLKIWLPQMTRGKSKDIYIFFAGHGLASDDGKDLHILPQDGDPILLEDTALSRIEMFDLINKVSPKSVTMFFDTCYSGQTRSEQMLVAGLRPVRIVADEQDTPNNFTIFTASNYDQTSGSINEAEHGIFSYYLMKGLEGNADANKDKELTNGELIAYLKNNVSQEAFTQNRSQEPMLAGDPDKVLMSYR